MKLLSSTQMAWAEPWFFVPRTRDRKGWMWRVLLALGIAVTMFVAMFFSGQQQNLLFMIGPSLAVGVLLVVSMDLPNIQRDVTIKEDCVIVGSAAGRGKFTTFKFEDIDSVTVLRQQESPNNWPMMVIDSGDIEFGTAIPRKVKLETVANVLHRLKVPVGLYDWEPPLSDSRYSVKNIVTIDPARVHGHIELTDVEETEPKLMGPMHIALQLMIALGPLVVALVGAIWGGAHLFLNWDVASVLKKVLIIGGSLAGLGIAFMYLVRIGQFIAAAYGVNVARKNLELRMNAFFRGTEDDLDLVTVEIFPRESWTAVVCKSTDFGFLRVGGPQQQLIFEGNKTRWILPKSAISACRIEECIVGSEGHDDAERRYYVVIEADNAGEPWQAGMVFTRTEAGADTPESRYERSQLLFARLAESIDLN